LVARYNITPGAHLLALFIRNPVREMTEEAYVFSLHEKESGYKKHPYNVKEDNYNVNYYKNSVNKQSISF
jgi:hypothetical protein